MNYMSELDIDSNLIFMEERESEEGRTVRILIVESNPSDVRSVRELISTQMRDTEVKVKSVLKLQEAEKLLREEDFDVILLELLLPDGTGLDTLGKMREQAPEVPIIIHTVLSSDALESKAMRMGAQDYFVKGGPYSNSLARSIRHAIERHRILVRLRKISLTDELTGLSNRHGFLTLAKQHFKLARRSEKGLLLLFVDIDSLRKINDKYGRHEGDLAIVVTGELIKGTFRESDIIARLGGDDFCALLMNASSEDAEVIRSRLEKSLEKHNSKNHLKYGLPLSKGILHFKPGSPLSFEDMMARADSVLLEEKLKKQIMIL